MGHETVEQLMEYQRALSGYEQRAATALEALASAPEDETEDKDGDE